MFLKNYKNYISAKNEDIDTKLSGCEDPVFQVSCQEPSMSFKYPHQGQGVLDTLLIML